MEFTSYTHRQTQDTRPKHLVVRLFIRQIHIVPSTTDESLTDGKEPMLIIIATISALTTPTGTLSPDACLIGLGVFRILLGIGVGGGCPMSASITSDRSNIRKRGPMLSYIFSNQGWESFVGGFATIIDLAIQPTIMDSMANYRRDFSRTCLQHFIPASHCSRVHAIPLGSKIEVP